MWKSLILAFLAASLLVAPAHAKATKHSKTITPAGWVNIDPGKPEDSWTYKPTTAFVDPKTGDVHVHVCTFNPECHPTVHPMMQESVYVTDAVINCGLHTMVWSDFMDVAHESRLGQASADRRAVRRQLSRKTTVEEDENKSLDQVEAETDEVFRILNPKAGLGLVIIRTCARKASLPRRDDYADDDTDAGPIAAPPKAEHTSTDKVSGTWAWSCCTNHNYRGALTISAVASDGTFTASYGDDSRVTVGKIVGDRISWTRHVTACGGGDQVWTGVVNSSGASLTIKGAWSGTCSELKNGEDFSATKQSVGPLASVSPARAEEAPRGTTAFVASCATNFEACRQEVLTVQNMNHLAKLGIASSALGRCMFPETTSGPTATRGDSVRDSTAATKAILAWLNAHSAVRNRDIDHAIVEAELALWPSNCV